MKVEEKRKYVATLTDDESTLLISLYKAMQRLEAEIFPEEANGFEVFEDLVNALEDART